MTTQLAVAGFTRHIGGAVEGKAASAAEIKAAAQTWYERQVAGCTAAHGERWPEHCAWIDDYLREELRQRLVARGWRVNEQHR